MTIDTPDKVDAALAGGQVVPIIKISATSEGAATFHSLWKVTTVPGSGATPPAYTAGSGYVPTKATVGALYNFTNPVSGETRIMQAGLVGATVGTVWIYDRIWHCSGFGTVATSAQACSAPGSLPGGRDPNNGLDVFPFGEVYTVPGATTAVWYINGTDANGSTGRTWAYTHPANAETAGQMVQFLPGGSAPATTLGIRVVNSFAAASTSGTAGDIGITLVRRLTPPLPLSIVNVSTDRDYAQLGRCVVGDDACLALQVMCSATNTGLIQGSIVLGQG